MKPINNSTSAAISWWQPSAWLRAGGPDAANFLQGQFTNDLRGLKPGGSVYGLWLSVKGKVLADSFVLRGTAEDEFWIGSYFSLAAVIRARLESHIIADDLVLEDVTEAWAGVTVFGDLGETVFPEPIAGGFAFRGRRGRDESIEWVFPAAMNEVVRARLAGATEINREELERRRIEAGIPAIPSDIGPSDLPNEGGLDADAISYNKGCYLGQEVMARLKSMGKLRRRLVRVSGKVPNHTGQRPIPLFAAGRQVGELRSMICDAEGNCNGLALVSLMHLDSDSILSSALEVEPTLRLLDAL